jgi:O6-methylguanine-DNA--protein-cysteine methyltransferase
LLHAKAQLAEYFSGKRQQFELPLTPLDGTVFQHQVWQALAMIPFGRFTSYADIARLLDKDQRTIWTVCNRAEKKLAGKNLKKLSLGKNTLGKNNGR